MSKQQLIGSICLTDLIEFAKKGHTSFSKAENGKIYANVKVWINETPDQFKNDASIQINPKADTGFKFEYIGNLRIVDTPVKNINEQDIQQLPEDDDLPF
jgi:hypothetical protein